MHMRTSEDAEVFGRGLYWQEIHPGQRFRTFRRTVTEADLVNFISATGMLLENLIDAHYELGSIKGRRVPAALTNALIEGLLFQSLLQGTGLALLELSLKAHSPVLVNDTIYGLVEVDEIKPTSRDNRAIVTSHVHVLNQRDELVLTYSVKRMLAGRPD